MTELWHYLLLSKCDLWAHCWMIISFWLKILNSNSNETEFFNRIRTYFRLLMSIESINKRTFFLIAFDHSFSLSSYSQRLESTALLLYVRFWCTVITLFRWWRSISISIRVYLNIFRDNRSEFLSNDSEIFLLNIMLCLKDDRFMLLYTATSHNDNNCLKCYLFHTSASSLSRSKMMMTEFVQ
jgi:hypothetical protein